MSYSVIKYTDKNGCQLDNEMVIRGTSATVKPTVSVPGLYGESIDIPMGASFYCIDTKDIYLYNSDNDTWVL